jgi:hypothetical protein
VLDATCRDDGPFRILRGGLGAAAAAALLLVAACAPQMQEGAPPTAPPQDESASPTPAPAPDGPQVSAAEVLDDALSAPEAFQLTPPEAEGLPPHRVGLLLPLSGPRADLGQAMLRAAELALFDVADARFALIVRDTQGTPEGARLAAEQAIAAGANLLLGPVFSTSVEAVAPVAQGGRVPVVAFSNDRQVARPGVWVTGLLPGEQVARRLSDGHARSNVGQPLSRAYRLWPRFGIKMVVHGVPDREGRPCVVGAQNASGVSSIPA